MAPLLAAGFTLAVPALGGTAFGGVSFATILAHATIIAGTVAVGYALQPSAPDPEQGTAPLKQTIPPRFYGMGEVKLAGVYTLFETRYGASFDIMALAQGPCGGFKKIYIDDKPVTVVGTVVQELPGGAYGDNRVFVAVQPGAKLATAYPIAQLTDIWTADHRLDRVVTLFLTCAGVKASDQLKRYPNGLPKASAVVFLPCWDFRDPAQDPDDADTWIDYPVYAALTTYAAGDRVLHGGIALAGMAAPGGMAWLCLEDDTLGVAPGSDAQRWAAVWKNPVLQAVTYMISPDIGMGLPRARHITPALADLTAQADICDEPVLKADASYESRYTSNPVYRLDTEPAQVLGLIFGACDAWAGLDGRGALALKVGVYEPPTVTLDADYITGVELAYGAEDESKLDELTLSYTSPDHDYTTQAVESWINDAAIFNRGQPRVQAFGPPSVQSPSQVRRLAKPLMLRATALKGVITTHFGGVVAAGQRFVAVEYPAIPELADAVIEIRRRETKFGEQCSYEFNVVADPAAMFGWTPGVEEGAIPVRPDIVVPDPLPVPDDLDGMAIGSPPFHIDLSWLDPARDDLTYIVRYRLSDAGGGVEGPWSEQRFGAPTLIGGRLFVTIFPTTADVYEVTAASIGPGGSFSEFVSPSIVVSTAGDVLTDDELDFLTDDDGDLLVNEM